MARINPVAQSSPMFTSLPPGQVTVGAMSQQTMTYWAQFPIEFFSGYRVMWVTPGRGGNSSSSRSVMTLDPTIMPVLEIQPARTATFTVDPFIVLEGKAHLEPDYMTRATLKARGVRGSNVVPVLTKKYPPIYALGRAVDDEEPAGTGMGETARWMPVSNTLSVGLWKPYHLANPTGPDKNVVLQGISGDSPVIDESFSYGPDNSFLTVAMEVPELSYFKMWGEARTGTQPITIFVVARVTPPVQRWVHLLSSIKSDRNTPMNADEPEMRLYPDGMAYLYTTGSQGAIQAVSDENRVIVFGQSLDADQKGVRMFTMDGTFKMLKGQLMRARPTTSSWFIGLSDEESSPLDILDILMFRDVLDDARIVEIVNELDGRYMLTAQGAQ
jgi:hypothetical protein